MKYLTVIITVILATLVPAHASVSLDVEGFGFELNGWKKNRTASYTLNNNAYRTHLPTATRTKGGGMFLSTRVERGKGVSAGAVCFLELTFSPEGHLVGAQIRASIQGKRLDTGLISRRAAAPIVPEGEPATEGWRTPESNLVTELFTRFDTELGKLDAKDGEKPRRDIFGRLSGSSSEKASIPAALRHNLNLLLKHVRHW